MVFVEAPAKVCCKFDLLQLSWEALIDVQCKFYLVAIYCMHVCNCIYTYLYIYTYEYMYRCRIYYISDHPCTICGHPGPLHVFIPSRQICFCDTRLSFHTCLGGNSEVSPQFRSNVNRKNLLSIRGRCNENCSVQPVFWTCLNDFESF